MGLSEGTLDVKIRYEAKNMARKKRTKRTKTWDNPDTDALARAVALLENPSEAKRFLRDLLTPDELIEFGHRFRAARLLAKDVHYAAITEDTGLSSSTIARVQKWRKDGYGGYKIVLTRLAGKNGK